MPCGSLKKCLTPEAFSVAAGLEDKLPDLRSQPDPIATSQLFFELLAPRLGDRTTAEWSESSVDPDPARQWRSGPES